MNDERWDQYGADVHYRPFDQEQPWLEYETVTRAMWQRWEYDLAFSVPDDGTPIMAHEMEVFKDLSCQLMEHGVAYDVLHARVFGS